MKECVGFAALTAQGAVVTPLSARETAALRKRWRRTYGAQLAREAGVPLSDQEGFDWHVFSYGIVRALEGDEAIEEYVARNHTELLVLPSGRSDLVGARCRCDAVPRLDDVDDVYVCPESFRWTMVFTHERGSLGPYFCRAAWLAA